MSGIYVRSLKNLRALAPSSVHFGGRIPRYLSTKIGGDEILVEDTNAGRVLTLNRPQALNALNQKMIRAMTSAITETKKEGSPIKLIIVQGAGGKAFCAGGDVVAVSKSFKEGSSVWRDFFHEEYVLNHLIGTLTIPYIAMIDGITMGGGCGVSINGQFRVATERTLLAMPETALGLFPDVGATYFLPRLKGKLGLFLALTGHRLRGSDVLRAGLATHYILSKDVESVMAELLKLKDPSVAGIDELIRAFQPKDITPFSLQPHLETIDRCFNAESLEAVFTALGKEKDEFCQKLLSELEKMSPTSLKVTFRQMSIGQSLKFEDVFPMEYLLTQRFLRENDFHEGVRAILIDKDRNPKWKPSRMEEVSEAKVDWYFSPLEGGDEEFRKNG